MPTVPPATEPGARRRRAPAYRLGQSFKRPSASVSSRASIAGSSVRAAICCFPRRASRITPTPGGRDGGLQEAEREIETRPGESLFVEIQLHHAVGLMASAYQGAPKPALGHQKQLAERGRGLLNDRRLERSPEGQEFWP